MEKFFENLISAEKTIRAADHIVYVTFPLIKDKRLLLKVIQETRNAVALCINAILQYEYMFKRINLYKDSKSNFRTFVDKCSQRYNISQQEIKIVLELFEIMQKHKESPFEFIKEEKIIILSNGLKPTTLTLEKTKEFLITVKEILRKTREIFGKNSFAE